MRLGIGPATTGGDQLRAPAIEFVATGLNPGEQTESIEGPTVDFGANRPGFAVQILGTLNDATVAGRIEQSATGASWATISGATFTSRTTSNHVERIAFTPTQRYVRWAGDITGGAPSAMLSVLFAR